MLGIQKKIYEWAYRQSRDRDFVWKNPFRQWLEDRYIHFLDSLRPRCWHKGCTNRAEPCVLQAYSTDDEDDVDQIYWYCDEHCQQHGFCRGCGYFWGGTESFDFGNGYCSNCRDEFEDDYYDEDEVWEYEL